MVGSLQVRGDMVLVVDAGQADPSRSVLDATGLPSGQLTAHRDQTLTLQLVDTYGNLLTKGGTNVQV